MKTKIPGGRRTLEESKTKSPLDVKEEISERTRQMSILILIVLLGITVLAFTGCQQPRPPTPSVITKVETQEVKVAVMPKIPELTCSFAGTGLEPTEKLLECLILHVRFLDYLRSKANKPAYDVTKYGFNQYLIDTYSDIDYKEPIINSLENNKTK